MTITNDIATLADPVLLANLTQLSCKENETTVEILLYLAEVEKRGLFLEAGYSSMFRFCTEGSLRYSEPAALRRITCARAVARFPMLVEEFLQKRLSLTTLSLVASQLSEENLAEVVQAIAGKSREQVEQYRSALRPKAEMPREQIRPIAVQKPKQAPESAPLFDAAKSGGVCQCSEHVRAREQLSVKPTAAGEGNSEPTTAAPEQRYEVRFTIGAKSHQKLQRAKALLLAKYPRGVAVEDVFEEALELLLDKHCPHRRHARRQQRASGAQPLASVPKTSETKPSRYVPTAVRDRVFVRDEGRCTYTSPDGVRCSETADLELHHIVPFGKMGGNEASNLCLRCRGHNAHQAIEDYGRQHMAQYLNCA